MKTRRSRLLKWGSVVVAMALAAGVFITGSSAQNTPAATPAPQPAFASAAEAGKALQAAARAKNQEQVSLILGPGAKEAISSGDDTEDLAALESFADRYDQMNRWIIMTDGSQILAIGADNYRFPVPLVKDYTSKWRFDAAAGIVEMLDRRIGRNEILALDAASAIADAEELYFQKNGQYTTRIISTPGKQDGLYWPVAAGQPLSPLGNVEQFAPGAITDGAASSAGALNLDGYSFRILTAQGAAADGGTMSYLVNGKFTGGFAVVAAPLQYLRSGVTTFILNREGILYEKDLGGDTASTAAAITAYDPDQTWNPVEDLDD